MTCDQSPVTLSKLESTIRLHGAEIAGGQSPFAALAPDPQHAPLPSDQVPDVGVDFPLQTLVLEGQAPSTAKAPPPQQALPVVDQIPLVEGGPSFPEQVFSVGQTPSAALAPLPQQAPPVDHTPEVGAEVPLQVLRVKEGGLQVQVEASKVPEANKFWCSCRRNLEKALATLPRPHNRLRICQACIYKHRHRKLPKRCNLDLRPSPNRSAHNPGKERA